ncbi:MAG TPA: tetratricopeptide repeat protein [Acidimicrobiales bacterium]|nr:tetratricopeptide repeat protein [Acidimicrobiales bacterium]
MHADDRLSRAADLYARALFFDDADALAEAEPVLASVDADLCVAQGRLLHARFLLARAHDPERAVEHPDELALFERARDRAAEAGDTRTEAEALFWIGCCLQVVRRDHDAAVPVLEASLERATVVGDHPTMAEALRHLGVAAHAAGRLDDARRHLEASTELRREADLPLGVASNLVGLTYVAAADGRLDDAAGALGEAAAIAEALGASGLLRQVEEARQMLHATEEAGHGA